MIDRAVRAMREGISSEKSLTSTRNTAADSDARSVQPRLVWIIALVTSSLVNNTASRMNSADIWTPSNWMTAPRARRASVATPAELISIDDGNRTPTGDVGDRGPGSCRLFPAGVGLKLAPGDVPVCLMSPGCRTARE